MSARDRALAWLASFSRVVRDARVVELDVLREIAKATPLVLATILRPSLADTAAAFRAAREGLLERGDDLYRDVYARHRAKLLEELEELPGDVKDAVLDAVITLEMRAFERFMGNAGLRSLPALRFTAPVRPVLDEADAILLSAWRDAIVDGRALAARRGLAEFLKAVTPAREESWKTILEITRKCAGRLQGATAGPRFEGYVSYLQGELFEHYALYSDELGGMYDDFLRTAAGRAGMLGDGWEAARSYGELKLALVPKVLVEATPGPLSRQSFKGWRKFADDSVLALKGRQGSTLGEADIVSLVQYKAVSDAESLIQQRIRDYVRVMLDDSGKTLLVAVGEEVYLMRPMSGESLTTFVSTGSLGLPIPHDPTLAALGVDIMRRNLPISRKEVRALAAALLREAVTAASRRPTGGGSWLPPRK